MSVFRLTVETAGVETAVVGTVEVMLGVLSSGHLRDISGVHHGGLTTPGLTTIG